ncbi:helix-turn-helix domain-containing protein [Streptomyces endocoffeicus]|nr:helix-turn-helix domain-containing protein [Streptomyces endocoffeicus]
MSAIEVLLRRMARRQCAALVGAGPGDAHEVWPQAARDLSDQLGIPLMATTAPPERWIGLGGIGLGDEILASRVASAEAQVEQLNALIETLPTQLADPKAMTEIAECLSATLEAQVLVHSEPQGILVAAPATAAEQLAQAFLRQSAARPLHNNPSVPHTQMISLAPATGAETVLAVTSETRLDTTQMRLVRHAAKLLGLVDQAHREYQAATLAPQAARLAAVQLLLEGEPHKARRVLSGLAPGLLEPDMARVFVIQTSQKLREPTRRRCETTTAGRALVVGDPQDARRILVINPVPVGDEADDSVAVDLTRIVATPGSKTSLGGSGLYSLTLVADALQEATTAQRFATHQANPVALSVQESDFISLLPQSDAQRWAHGLLHPLMETGRQWDQFRETLPVALAHPYTVAAQLLELHRNTVTKKVSRAGKLLGVDLTAVRHRVSVGLALELVTRREPVASPHDGSGTDSGSPPDLRTLLQTRQVSLWADAFLSPARRDRRDLLTTATCWLAYDTHVEPAARALGLSEATVRNHLRALEAYLARDLSSLTGLRDLAFSLHISGLAQIIESTSAQLASVA